MKKLTVIICAVAALASVAFGGTETYSSSKEMKAVQGPPPCPEWYRAQEWEISLWGTYAFTGTNWRDDRYLGVDHAWGGGIDAKYFFHRYFGIGIEGYGLATNHQTETFVGSNGFAISATRGNSAAGSVLGTMTFRYPIPCSRFAPYAFAGGGALFGGGDGAVALFAPDGTVIGVRSRSTETRAVGQFGGGIEVRLTPTIGWMNDFSWNVVDGPKNNFGMVRSGLTFAF